MCKYCEQFNYKSYDVEDDKTYHHATCLIGEQDYTYLFAAITSNKRLLVAGEDTEQGWYYFDTVRIKYCPMCGRKL